ncbi:MAG TPA: DUF3311 domain-containing protein [Candidatus Polarisedimenticolia bacterium]|nr:DUF3311 domain-containing protein [Candidatus Polarisedimenticolia bacterium]
MSRRARRWLPLAVPAVLFLLHNDFWLWNDPRIVLGLPVGMLYHAAYCVLATFLMALLVRHAWPAHLEVEAPEETRQ